jgi:hypothetical protein
MGWWRRRAKQNRLAQAHVYTFSCFFSLCLVHERMNPIDFYIDREKYTQLERETRAICFCFVFFSSLTFQVYRKYLEIFISSTAIQKIKI